MNIFNRIVMILSILLLLFVLVVLLLQPLAVLEWARQGLDAFENFLYERYLYFLAGTAVCLFLLLILFWLEIWRRPRRTVKVRQVGSGDVQLSVTSISQNLEHHISELAGVIRVKPTVLSRGKAVDVILDLETSPEVHVPSKTDQVCQVARTVIEEKLGLKLRKIRANIKPVSYTHLTLPTKA